MPVQSFVYAFHMPLFFFVSGYLYDERKYGDRPFVYISRRVKSTWMKYILWEMLFILFHNFFYRLGMLDGVGIESHLYSGREAFSRLAEAVLGCANEVLVGALWFAPVLVIAVSGMGLMIAVSRKLEQVTGSEILKLMFQLLCVVAVGTIGYICIKNQQAFPASMQISLAVVPYIWGGYLVRNYFGKPEKYLNGPAAAFLLIPVILISRKYLISLANGFVYPFMYLPAFMGIYVCLYLAKILRRSSACGKVFSLLGEASFFLMATHLFVIRCIDRIYCMRFGEEWEIYYARWPASFDELVPVYLLVSVGMGTGIWVWYRKGKKLLADRLQRLKKV